MNAPANVKIVAAEARKLLASGLTVFDVAAVLHLHPDYIATLVPGAAHGTSKVGKDAPALV